MAIVSRFDLSACRGCLRGLGDANDSAAEQNIALVRRAYDAAVEADSGWSVTSQAQSVSANIEKLGDQIDYWASTQRRFAEQGRTDAGVPFTWSKWSSLGKDLFNAANYLAKVSVDGSQWRVLVDTVKQTADDATNPLAWPTWLKGAAVAAGVVGALWVANLVRDLRR